MLISYKWLQSYFEEKLPQPEKLAELITFGFAEVESIKSLEASDFADSRGLKTRINADRNGGDTVLDIKVLPDRACYALSHRGVAYEVGAILGLKRKDFNWPQPAVTQTRSLEVRVEAPELCPRYMARVIENVTAKDLSWVKEHLEAIGQRMINPIVDGANIVMFDMGQPLHAFDADKVEGGIVVRRARRGEKITTLDNRKVVLDEEALVIADEKSPLAIAGIKGGKKAEVTSATRNLILESANFNASHIRKTAERLCIKTDALKRFENKLSPELASVGMNDFSAYLFEMDKNIKVGEIVNTYPKKQKERTIVVSKEYIAKKLGIEISSNQIEEVMSRLLVKMERKKGELMLTPPAFRMDLNIPEDIAEEVGRIIGYDKIPAMLPPKLKGDVSIPKSFYYEWKIRELLVNAGFSEVMTSSFAEKGSMAILKPLAEDKKYARPDLRGGFVAALRTNTLNAPLFCADEIKIFEIGRVFTKNGERTALALGIAGSKKKVSGVLESAVKKLSETLRTTLNGDTKDGVFECALDSVFEKLTEPTRWNISIPLARADLLARPAQARKFQPFSLYPFIVRDVAIFVPPDILSESIEKVIKENAGELVVHGPSLFDEFSKDGKKSLAFRLVFQSFGRTLSDEEVNKIMEKVYAALTASGWHIR